jgi:hypothetical protein
MGNYKTLIKIIIMKRPITVFLLSLFFLIACNQNETSNTETTKNAADAMQVSTFKPANIQEQMI